MKKILFFILAATLCAACQPKNKQSAADVMAGVEGLCESCEECEASDEEMNFKPLNEIRFGSWSDQDWLDNDYFRHLRKHIDKWLAGEVECPELEKYKAQIGESRFVIINAEPFVLGGMFIDFAFVEVPNLLFQVNVYSDVDEEKAVVTDYSVRAIKLADDKAPFTKEHILHIIKEHPENKLW
ncbi:MAG: membrane lipoprotein lipid attachment site-containing protein [Alistipes sp.]|nr:membrane lipoprotein lipid attachment site-containing protein [Alistipes sp.]